MEVRSALASATFRVPKTGSRVVLRAELFPQIREVFDLGIGLVTAGAGFGKTTLLSSWVAALDRPCTVVWITCREEHNDLRFLVNDLASALGEDLEEHRYPSLSTVVGAASQAHEEVLIVLDDAHLLTADSVVGALGQLLESRPSNVYIVLSCRETPDLPWYRLRARGEVVEIRGRDLRSIAPRPACS